MHVSCVHRIVRVLIHGDHARADEDVRFPVDIVAVLLDDSSALVGQSYSVVQLVSVDVDRLRCGGIVLIFEEIATVVDGIRPAVPCEVRGVEQDSRVAKEDTLL